MYGLIESLLLSVVLLLCLWHVSGRVMPQGRAGLQSLLARWLLSHEGRPRLQRIGLKLLPRVDEQSCGSACSRCGACGIPDSPRRAVQIPDS